jgi:leader peptidase (prepilin peptidase) / N-methyltransferase
MTVLLMVFAGLLGLTVGSFANVVAHRVPAGISLLRPSGCPICNTPIKAWQNIPILSWLLLRGRCASCGSPIAVRYLLIEAANGIAFAALAWFVPEVLGLSGATAVLVWSALAWFAVVSSILVLVDLDTYTLPNVIVLPSYGVALVLLSLAGAFGGDWDALLRAVAGMAAMYGAYWLIRLIRPDGMGGGDVKLAGLAGLYLGWLGWGALMVGWFAAFLSGAVFGVVLMVRGKANRGTAVAFGPWLLAGAWVGICFGNWIGYSYAAFSGLI